MLTPWVFHLCAPWSEVEPFPGGMVWKGFLPSPATAWMHMSCQGFPALLPAEAEQYFHCLNEFYCTFLCDSCTWGETQEKRAEERSRKLPEEAKRIPVGPFAASCHRVLVTRGCTQVFCVGGLKMPMGTADGCPAPTAWAESAEIWLWGC